LIAKPQEAGSGIRFGVTIAASAVFLLRPTEIFRPASAA